MVGLGSGPLDQIKQEKRKSKSKAKQKLNRINKYDKWKEAVKDKIHLLCAILQFQQTD